MSDSTLSHLDPGQEHRNSDGVVELRLAVAEEVKVGVLVWLVQQVLKQLVNLGGEDSQRLYCS